MSSFSVAMMMIGSFLLSLLLLATSRWRGAPLVINNRWFAIPNLSLVLLFNWMQWTEASWQSWGLAHKYGVTLGAGVAVTSALLASRFFPRHWGGIYILGVAKADLSHALKSAVRSFDPHASLRAEKWHSEDYHADVHIDPGFGEFNLKLRFGGEGARVFAADMLPLLKLDLAELELEPRQHFAITVLKAIFFVGMTLAVFGSLLAIWTHYDQQANL